MAQNNTNYQAHIDSEHLRLLSIFHFVAAGLGFLGVMMSTAYFFLFQMLLSDPRMMEQSQQGPPPEVLMDFFKVFIVIFFIWFLVAAVGNLLAALFMRKKRHRVFVMVMSGINCLHIPIGTALGIFTLIVLSRDSVRRAFESEPR